MTGPPLDRRLPTSALLAVALLASLVALGGCSTRTVTELPDFGPAHERLAAGDVAGALAAAKRLLDPVEDAEPQVCAAIEALALRFYEVGTHESVQAAREIFERALALRERRPEDDPAGLGQSLHDLSGLAFNDGSYERAEEYERRALAVRERALGATANATIESRRDLGYVFTKQGRLAEARPHLEQALAALEAAPEPDALGIAIAINYLADLDRIEGRHADAEARLAALIRAGPDALGDARNQFTLFLNNLAGIYRDQERFAEAETLLRQSLALREAEEPRDPGYIAVATLNLAELYRVQGQLDDAEPLYLRARELAVIALGPDSQDMVEFVSQLGVLYRERGDLARAEPLIAEALHLARPGSDELRVATAAMDLGEVQRLLGRCDEARNTLAEAVAIRERILGPAHPSVAEALVVQARCLVADPEARESAQQTLDRAIANLEDSENHPLSKIEALSMRAELAEGRDPASAARDLAAAVEYVEQLRPLRGGGEGSRAEFLDRYGSLYARRVRLEVEAGRPARALEISERARARVLLDQLAVARVGEHATGGPAAERQRRARSFVAELRERIEFEQSRPGIDAGERRRRLADLDGQIEGATRELRTLWDEMRNDSPAWRAATGGSALSAGELQRRIVPGDGVALVYSLGDERSFVFVVPPPPATIEAFPLSIATADAAALRAAAGPLSRSDVRTILGGLHDGGAPSGLLARLSAVRAATTRGLGGIATLDGDPTAALHALWRTLVPQPVWQRIADLPRVVVVPDGPLCLLPFEALVLDRGRDARSTRYWLDDGPAIRYAPSATALAKLVERDAKRRKSDANQVLSVSDPAYAAATAQTSFPSREGVLPRLPGTARESRAILEAFGDASRVVLLHGEKASEAAVRREIADKRWVHLATHGIVDERKDALFAALALAPPTAGAPRSDDDGLLELLEIYELELDCDLAVLSACRSNAGRLVTSEGVFALSRGFLVAGARSVVASQWSVDDASTADLVGELFSRIASARRDGRSPDVTIALRDAKLTLRRDPRWAHPFFWAPFVLTGLDTHDAASRPERGTQTAGRRL